MGSKSCHITSHYSLGGRDTNIFLLTFRTKAIKKPGVPGVNRLLVEVERQNLNAKILNIKLAS